MTFQFRLDGTVAIKSSSSWEGFSYNQARSITVADALGTIAKTLSESSGFALSPKNAPMWLNDVYSFVHQNQERKAVDILYEKVDDLLVEKKFLQCDDLLQTIDLKRLNSNLIVSILAMTKNAAEDLPYRKKLLRRSRTILDSITPGRAERLLSPF